MLMRVKLPGVAAATSQQEPPGGDGAAAGVSYPVLRTLPIHFGLRVVWFELMFPAFPSPEVIHYGEIYLWSGGNIIGLHQLIIASGHKLGH